MLIVDKNDFSKLYSPIVEIRHPETTDIMNILVLMYKYNNADSDSDYTNRDIYPDGFITYHGDKFTKIFTRNDELDYIADNNTSILGWLNDTEDLDNSVDLLWNNEKGE